MVSVPAEHAELASPRLKGRTSETLGTTTFPRKNLTPTVVDARTTEETLHAKSEDATATPVEGEKPKKLHTKIEMHSVQLGYNKQIQE
jgi:hypothetical protein